MTNSNIVLDNNGFCTDMNSAPNLTLLVVETAAPKARRVIAYRDHTFNNGRGAWFTQERHAISNIVRWRYVQANVSAAPNIPAYA